MKPAAVYVTAIGIYVAGYLGFEYHKHTCTHTRARAHTDGIVAVANENHMAQQQAEYTAESISSVCGSNVRHVLLNYS